MFRPFKHEPPRILNHNLPFVCWVLFAPAASLATVIAGEEEKTGLRAWELREEGISIQLIQRRPDQTRAFFEARGFSNAEAGEMGESCIFQAIFRNDGRRPVRYDLDAWRVVRGGGRRALFTREYWDRHWQGAGVSPAAVIALHWSLLPTRQSFEPGDYNWGMISFGLPPGESFDLSMLLEIGGERVAREIPGIVCATDQPEN